MPVLTLKHPPTVGGAKIEALTLRRANAGDIRALDKSGGLELMMQLAERGGEQKLPAGLVDKLIPFLARVCGVDEAVIEALDAEDFFALFDRIEEAMPGPLPGPPSSGR